MPALVRVRFENPASLKNPEVAWVISLTGKGTEVMIDRWSFMPPGEPFHRERDNPERKAPLAVVAVMALSGMTTIKTSAEAVSVQPPPSPSVAVWDSGSGKLFVPAQQAGTLPDWINPKAKVSAKVLKVRQDLEAAFTSAVDQALTGLLRANEPLDGAHGGPLPGGDRRPGRPDRRAGQRPGRDALGGRRDDARLDCRLADNDYVLYDELKQRTRSPTPRRS